MFSNDGVIPVVCRYGRGWIYHKELRLWLMRVANMEPLVKTNAYERGSYHCFDPSTFEIVRKVLTDLCSFHLFAFFYYSRHWQFSLISEF